MNQWVIEYDWRSNESYPSSFSNQGQLATNAMSKWIHNKFRLQKRKVNLTCLKSTQSFKSITHYSSNWFNVVVIFSLLTITLSRVLMSNSDKTKYFFVSCSVIMAVATSGTLEWRDSYNETLNCGFRRLKGQRYHGTERTAVLKSSGNNWGDN